MRRVSCENSLKASRCSAQALLCTRQLTEDQRWQRSAISVSNTIPHGNSLSLTSSWSLAFQHRRHFYQVAHTPSLRASSGISRRVSLTRAVRRSVRRCVLHIPHEEEWEQQAIFFFKRTSSRVNNLQSSDHWCVDGMSMYAFD
jgi:hypothetical protein